MRVISHRGWWSLPHEKNRPVAMRRSFEAGLGTETDLRDLGGEIVISHDPPRGADEVMTFEQLLALYVETGGRDAGLPLALNIKSDGLACDVDVLVEKFSVRAGFVFDMAIPDMRTFLTQRTLDVFTRQSDVEPVPAYLDQAQGVWLDSFGPDDWITPAVIMRHIEAGRRVCVVSSDLHQRPPENLWARLVEGHRAGTLGDDVLVCTDRPEQLLAFLGEERG